MARRALLNAALNLTRLAPSGSHLYAVHIWLHAWTDRTVLVDGTQRLVSRRGEASPVSPGPPAGAEGHGGVSDRLSTHDRDIFPERARMS